MPEVFGATSSAIHLLCHFMSVGWFSLFSAIDVQEWADSIVYSRELGLDSRRERTSPCCHLMCELGVWCGGVVFL